jgi:distribution and morphology protein 31
MSGAEGPISWITSGKVDAVFDIKFPRSPADDIDIGAVLSGIAATMVADSERIPGQRELAKPPLIAPPDAQNAPDNSEDSTSACEVAIDIDLRFRDLKAAVPIFTRDLSYMNSALIRPIVAFIK